jgi:hypothetical protein
MSYYWQIYCFTCNEGVGTCANHADKGLSDLVKAILPAVKALKTLEKELISALFIDLEVWGVCGEDSRKIPIEWFIKHEDHDVTLLDQYGQRHAGQDLRKI